MITSWVLVIIVYSNSSSMAIIPNLKDLKECQRIHKIMDDKGLSNTKTFCMETINK